MRIPESIQLGGHTITVEFQSDLVANCEAYGLFDPTNLRIIIDRDVDPSIQSETFWHEVVEAIVFFTEAGLEHSKIQTFGILLHQISASMEVDGYEDTEKKKRR